MLSKTHHVPWRKMALSEWRRRCAWAGNCERKIQTTDERQISRAHRACAHARTNSSCVFWRENDDFVMRFNIHIDFFKLLTFVPLVTV